MSFKYNPSAPGMGPSPNSVMRGENFYISYNDYDHDIYGGATTALVVGQMERFYLLNGDHRRAYAELVPQGFDTCMTYFRDHIEQMNFRSDPAPEPAQPENSEAEAAPGFRP